MKKVLVLGASPNPARYAYLAVKQLKAHGHEVVAVGLREGEIDDVQILTGMPTLENIDTVTLYVNPTHQQPYHDYVLGLKPRRIIFNPGTEHYPFMQAAKQAGIEAFPACTLVMLATRQF